MKEINLRDFYPWYMEDVMVEVTEEVAEELLAGQRYIKASRRRVYRNKAHFSLDAEDGIEYSACFSNPSPQELIERMERFEHICHALNSLPDAQGQRVFEHYLLNHSVKAIAAAEGVTERAINAAIQRGFQIDIINGNTGIFLRLILVISFAGLGGIYHNSKLMFCHIPYLYKKPRFIKPTVSIAHVQLDHKQLAKEGTYSLRLIKKRGKSNRQTRSYFTCVP